MKTSQSNNSKKPLNEEEMELLVILQSDLRKIAFGTNLEVEKSKKTIHVTVEVLGRHLDKQGCIDALWDVITAFLNKNNNRVWDIRGFNQLNY